MSGTSGDGVDASLINSDGETNYNVETNKYFEYENNFSQKIHALKDKINNVTDLETYSTELKALEKELTIFHSKVVMDIIKCAKEKIDFVGFHGQTIFHDPSKKISKQIGDGKLLSQLTQTTVVYNFRQNDIKKLRVVSMFAGCGRLDFAFHKQSKAFEVIYVNDFDQDSCDTYKTYYKHEPVCSDIARIATIPDCDILTGGFPCQGFSVANLYRKESDSRNKLYLELVRRTLRI